MNWRLLIEGPANGAYNMAVDEALLESLAAPESQPVLRFYDWQPSCLSIGRFQKFEGLEAVSSAVRHGEPGIHWVRRPTGGRAVWHHREITYCAVLRADSLPPHAQSVAGAYRYLSEAFIGGLETLGIHAALAPAESKEQRETALRTANCFASATRCDFLVDGRKLIGAAQCRRNGVILQHGSLLLDLDKVAWSRAIGSETAGMIALSELGVHKSRETIIAALCAGLQRSLGITLVQDQLRSGEARVAKGLQLKYHSAKWNNGGIEPTAASESTQDPIRAV